MKAEQYYNIFLIENNVEDSKQIKKLFYNAFSNGILAVKKISESNSRPQDKVVELNLLGSELIEFKKQK